MQITKLNAPKWALLQPASQGIEQLDQLKLLRLNLPYLHPSMVKQKLGTFLNKELYQAFNEANILFIVRCF